MYSPCIVLPNVTSTSSAQVPRSTHGVSSSYSSCPIASHSGIGLAVPPSFTWCLSNTICVSWSLVVSYVRCLGSGGYPFHLASRSWSSHCISSWSSSCARMHSLWTSLASSGVSPSWAVADGGCTCSGGVDWGCVVVGVCTRLVPCSCCSRLSVSSVSSAFSSPACSLSDPHPPHHF